MDGSRFDTVTRQLATGVRARRELLRLAVGGGVAALGLGAAVEEAAACRKTGQPCANGNKDKQNRSCCSGTCKRGKCRPTPGAFGCTVNDDYCKLPEKQRVCPQRPGSVCVVLDNGKPFCSAFGLCSTCASDADCTEVPGIKCIKTCPACGPAGQACAYPPA